MGISLYLLMLRFIGKYMVFGRIYFEFCYQTYTSNRKKKQLVRPAQICLLKKIQNMHKNVI